MTQFEIFIESLRMLISERTEYSTRYDIIEGVQIIDDGGEIKHTIDMNDLHRYDNRFLHDRPQLVLNYVPWTELLDD